MVHVAEVFGNKLIRSYAGPFLVLLFYGLIHQLFSSQNCFRKIQQIDECVPGGNREQQQMGKQQASVCRPEHGCSDDQ